MNKTLLILVIALHTFSATAQITVNVPTAGTFSTVLTSAGGNANTVTNLIVSGNINAIDLFFMRDSMPVLAILDLEAVQILPVNEIPSNAFYGKTSLTSIKLPASATSIGISAFHGCTGLTCNLVLPNSITNIGGYAFYNCNKLTGNLIIPATVTTIGGGAFGYCKQLTDTVTIPASVNIINVGAFEACNKITFFNVDDNNVFYKDIDGVLFTKNVSQLLQFPSGKIANSYSIPNTVTSIGGNAFDGCLGLTGYLTIPNSVIYIGANAFRQCSGLTGSLDIPNSVTSIYSYAFLYCTGLTSITIPNSVTNIGLNAFYGTDKVVSINVEDENTHYMDIDGVLFNRDTTTIYQFPSGKKLSYYEIPNSVTYIEDNAFTKCTGLIGNIFIPNSVTSFGRNVFYDCVNLQKIIVAIPEPLDILQYMFYNVKKTTCVLVVPVGSKIAYQNADYWKDFTNISDGFMVQYDERGGSAVADTAVNYNAGIIEHVPTRKGYSFLGWYKEASYTNLWNFATDIINSDTTLYAKWKSNGTNPPNSIDTKNNTSLSLFPNPATDFVRIEGEKIHSITIYNLLGDAQLQLYPQGTESVSFDISALKYGCYLVLIETIDGKEIRTMFLKQ